MRIHTQSRQSKIYNTSSPKRNLCILVSASSKTPLLVIISPRKKTQVVASIQLAINKILKVRSISS